MSLIDGHRENPNPHLGWTEIHAETRRRNMRTWEEIYSHCWGQGRPTFCLSVIHNHFWKHFGISYALVTNIQERCILKILPIICSTVLSICKFLINDFRIHVLHIVLRESYAHLGPKALLIVLTQKKLTSWTINLMLQSGMRNK